MNTTLAAAQDYLTEGYSIIPLVTGDKRPAVDWKPFQQRNPSLEELEKWFGGEEGLNLGIVTGPISNLLVLDFDNKEALDRLETEFGAIPRTRAVKTGKGVHLYFRYPSVRVGNRTGVWAGFDVRGEGGYVVAPPSIHPNGTKYTCDEREIPVADLPQDLLELLIAEPQVAAEPVREPGKKVVEGGRNSHLTKLAGKLAKKQHSRTRLHRELHALNATECDPPLPDEEVETIARSIAHREWGSQKRIASIMLSEIENEEIDWLWKGFLAKGHMTLLDGAPGQGKSMVITDLIARFTTGREWPDGSPGGAPGRVLIIRPEDHLSSVVAPRLRAAGADESMIRLFGVEEDAVEFPRDFEEAERAIREFRPDLVVIDPLGMVMGTGTDANRQEDVVSILQPWRRLAEELDFAQLTARHTKKNVSGGAMSAGAGSFMGNGIARAVFLIGKDPTQPHKRVLASTKNNLAQAPDSHSFVIVGEDGMPKVEWLGRVNLTADDLTLPPRGPLVLDKAVAFVRTFLEEASWSAVTTVKDAAIKHGHAERTIERAMGQGPFTRRTIEEGGKVIKQIGLAQADAMAA
jgi:hypothetical protein